jgi:hypothetical protein
VRQQAAQFGATLCGRHLVGWKRIGAFHAGLGVVVSSGLYSSTSDFVPANPAQVEESRTGTYQEHLSFRKGDSSWLEI